VQLNPKLKNVTAFIYGVPSSNFCDLLDSQKLCVWVVLIAWWLWLIYLKEKLEPATPRNSNFSHFRFINPLRAISPFHFHGCHKISINSIWQRLLSRCCPRQQRQIIHSHLPTSQLNIPHSRRIQNIDWRRQPSLIEWQGTGWSWGSCYKLCFRTIFL
jgi:hypothetical protein